MGFLAPSILFALVLAGIPVVLHLLARRQPRIVPFAPVELVRRAEADVHRRLRIRDAVLLAVRVLLVLFVVLALARPFVRMRGTGVAAVAGAEALVVVLDDSMSMRAKESAPFERARTAALGTLDALGSGDSAALVLAGRPIRVPFARMSFDLAAVRRVVAETEASFRGTDVAAAIEAAARLVRTSTSSWKRIVVLTDLQRTGWQATGARSLPDDVSIDVVDVGEPLSNLALVSVEFEPAPELGAGFARVTAVVRNHSRQPATAVGISLVLGDVTLARGSVDVPAGETVRKVFHHRFDPSSLQIGEVRISDDDLLADDRRAFLSIGSRALRVLVVDGDPRPATRADEVFYVVRALAPGGDSDMTPVVVETEGLAEHRLDDYDAVFLCNVPLLDGGAVDSLVEYVRGGGGALFSVGNRVRASEWNRSLGELMPAMLLSARDVSDADASGLDAPDVRHPLFAVFPEGAPGLIDTAVRTYVTLDPDSVDSPAVLLRLSSGAPLLVERRLGAGRVLLFTSTLDADWTDLPLRTGYLPLVRQAVHHLARRAGPDSGRSHHVGEEVSLTIPPGTSSVVVQDPEGRRHDVDADGTRVRFRETDLPGGYRVFTEGRVGGLREDPALAFLVTTDPAESDPSRWRRPPVTTAALRAGAATTKRAVPLWPTFLGLLVPLAVGEAVLRAWRVRGRRQRIPSQAP